jgi:hypothetical protein
VGSEAFDGVEQLTIVATQLDHYVSVGAANEFASHPVKYRCTKAYCQEDRRAAPPGAALMPCELQETAPENEPAVDAL